MVNVPHDGNYRSPFKEVIAPEERFSANHCTLLGGLFITCYYLYREF